MEFLHSDLGHLRAGSVALVELSGTAANVRLLDDANLARFRRGDSHRCVGGHFRRSPARLVVPSTGRWNVVVDVGGYEGAVSASVRVLRRR